MNHDQILKRSWNIFWNYKVLWVFGFLLALTSTGGVNGGGGNNSGFRRPAETFPFRLEDLSPEMRRALSGIEHWFTPEMLATWIGLGIALICLALLAGIIFAIIKYVSLVAQMRMVDDHETTGEKVGFRQGWRLGWSRYAWRVFLIDLAIGIPLTIILVGMFGCALLPVILGAMGDGEPGFGWVMTTIGLVFILLFVILVISLALGLVINLIRRSCVLGGEGVINSIKAGLKLFRSNFKDASVMWLILAGIHIAYSIVMIPVFLLLLVLGLLVGGGAGAATYFGLQALTSQVAAIAAAIILGLFLFFTTLGLPLNFLEGLRLTYFSTAWTLTYRELARAKPLEALAVSPVLPLPGDRDIPGEIQPPQDLEPAGG
jgi:hypothetical protein